MFQPRSREFDPRLTAIADHLRAIEQELGSLGKSAGQHTSARASAIGDQIAETITPILSEIAGRFRRGRPLVTGAAANFGNEAVRIGARVGGDALGRITSQAKQRPFLVIAVAVGVGILIGVASRRT